MLFSVGRTSAQLVRGTQPVAAMAANPRAALHALWIFLFSYTTNEGTFVNVLNNYTEVFVSSIFQ